MRLSSFKKEILEFYRTLDCKRPDIFKETTSKVFQFVRLGDFLSL